MNVKISVFVICVEAIIYLLSYNLHDGTFKADSVIFITIISFFSILGHKKFIKVICIVCSFHLVKCALSNYVLLLFRSILSYYWALISHVSLCKYELGFSPN